MYVKPEDDKKKGMIAIEHQNHVKEEDFEEYYNNLTTQLLQGVPEENHLLYRYRAHELYRKLTDDKGGDLEEVGEYKWARVVIKHDYDPVKRVGTIIIEAIRIEKGKKALSSVRLRYKFTYRTDKAGHLELKWAKVAEDGTPWIDNDIEQNNEAPPADVSCQTGLLAVVAEHMNHAVEHMSHFFNFSKQKDPEDRANAPKPAQYKTLSFVVGSQKAVLEAYRAAGELLSKTHGDEQSSLTQSNAERNLFSAQKLTCIIATVTTIVTLLGLAKQFWPPAKNDTSG
eukprot:GEMP01055775.1.p1 GENE.GEMP01055775.1~~GEMP01055775.1.p1  ORF type:complete len:284 (+),score=38.36 GEMP01055775.1:449-1300(+)